MNWLSKQSDQIYVRGSFTKSPRYPAAVPRARQLLVHPAIAHLYSLDCFVSLAEFVSCISLFRM